MFKQIAYAFYYSHPEYYFITNGFNVTYNSGGEYGVYGCRFYPQLIDQFADPNQRRAYQSVINTVTDNVMAKVEGVSEPLEQELIICKYITDTIEYKLKTDGSSDEDNNSQTIAGALVDKTCVCNGYAMAASYFLNALGIDTLIMTGCGHAWNIVQLYGNWYELDLTWADNEGNEIDMGWVNKSYATFLKNDYQNVHFYDEDRTALFDIPDCLYDTVIKTGTATLRSVVLTPPTKSDYFKGEALDLTGGYLLLTYSDGYEETIDLEESMVTGFDSTKTGAKALTVTYKDLKTTFTVTVAEPAKEVIKIKISKKPKTKYYFGEELDLTNGTLTVTYKDKSNETVSITEDMVTGYDSGKTGSQSLKVTFGGVSATLRVTVLAAKISKLGISREPKSEYYLNEEPDFSSGVLMVTYTDNSVKEISLTDKDVTVTGFDSRKKGNQKITIAYGGKKIKYTVKVVSNTNEAPVMIGGKGYDSFAEALKSIAQKGDYEIVINDEYTETKAIEAMKEVKDYVVIVNDDIKVTGKINLQTNVKSLTIEGSGGVKTITIGSKISTNVPLILKNIKLTADLKSTAKITVNGTVTIGGALTASEMTSTEGAVLTAKSISITSGGISADSKTITLKLVDADGNALSFAKGDVVSTMFKGNFSADKLTLDGKTLSWSNGKLYLAQ